MECSPTQQHVAVRVTTPAHSRLSKPVTQLSPVRCSCTAILFAASTRPWYDARCDSNATDDTQPTGNRWTELQPNSMLRCE
eukprot:6572874-Prymnesium_polylepis.1